MKNIPDDYIVSHTKAKSLFPLKKIVSYKDNKIYMLDIDNILYLYCQDNEVMIVMDNNITYNAPYTLRFWEQKLSQNHFFRCQRGYLVNLDKVSEIVPSYNSTFVLMLEKHKSGVPLGRNYIKDFKEIVGW